MSKARLLFACFILAFEILRINAITFAKLASQYFSSLIFGGFLLMCAAFF